MPTLTKIDQAAFNAKDEPVCEQRKTPAFVRQYAGDIPTHLDLVDIPANTYQWLVFVPCDMIGDVEWPSMFKVQTVIGLDNRRHQRTHVMPTFDHYEMDARGVLFAFPAREGGKVL